MTIEYLSLSELLHLYRERRNISQRQLAIQLNLDPSLISKWENQSRVPSLTTIQQIAHALKLQSDQEIKLADARDALVAEPLALHELLSLYLHRIPLTDSQIIKRLGDSSRDKLRAWRRGSSVPSNQEMVLLARTLEFDQHQIDKLLTAKPRLHLSQEELEFILLGSGRIRMEHVSEVLAKGIELALKIM